MVHNVNRSNREKLKKIISNLMILTKSAFPVDGCFQDNGMFSVFPAVDTKALKKILKIQQ
jgi:hypothetical protein